MPTTDICNIDDIVRMVNSFYDKVRKDELLGPVFNEVIGEAWPTHLEKMYRFWQTILLNEHTYQGSPFPPHAQLPITAAHFARWQHLFVETVDAHFKGAKAEEAKWRAQKMAEMFQIKIAHLRNTRQQSIV